MGNSTSASSELPQPVRLTHPGSAKCLPPAKWTLYEDTDPPNLRVDDFSVLSVEQAKMVCQVNRCLLTSQQLETIRHRTRGQQVCTLEELNSLLQRLEHSGEQDVGTAVHIATVIPQQEVA
jgi:hypothetical protein